MAAEVGSCSILQPPKWFCVSVERQNDRLTLWANRGMTGEWEKETNWESKVFSLFLLKLDFFFFEQQKMQTKKQTNIKKNNIQTVCPCRSTTHTVFVTPTYKMLYFTWAFCTKLVKGSVYSQGVNLGPRASIYSERFPDEYINNCACSMHRNDLHDGMFWSEILHELS